MVWRQDTGRSVSQSNGVDRLQDRMYEAWITVYLCSYGVTIITITSQYCHSHTVTVTVTVTVTLSQPLRITPIYHTYIRILHFAATSAAAINQNRPFVTPKGSIVRYVNQDSFWSAIAYRSAQRICYGTQISERLVKGVSSKIWSCQFTHDHQQGGSNWLGSFFCCCDNRDFLQIMWIYLNFHQSARGSWKLQESSITKVRTFT